MPRTVRITLEIDAKLHEELISVAKENGQSQRFVLERALEHYLHNVVPSQRMVRPEVMAAYRRSNEISRAVQTALKANPSLLICHPEAAESSAPPRTPNEGPPSATCQRRSLANVSGTADDSIGPSGRKKRGPEDDNM